MSQLRALRKSKHLSQKALAERLDVQQSTVSHWEAGKVNPCRKYLLPLAKALDITVDELKTII